MKAYVGASLATDAPPFDRAQDSPYVGSILSITHLIALILPTAKPSGQRGLTHEK